jgi:hypothetical protein
MSMLPDTVPVILHVAPVMRAARHRPASPPAGTVQLDVAADRLQVHARIRIRVVARITSPLTLSTSICGRRCSTSTSR